jgi:hypothetical protein
MNRDADEYVTRQIKALLEAVQDEGATGVGTRSFQLAEHLAAEGGIHREDIMAATALLLAMMAWCDGEVDVAERFARRMRGHSRESLELLLQTMRLETGWDQGWLPRAEREELIEYAKRVGRADMELRAQAIEPRDVDSREQRRHPCR